MSSEHIRDPALNAQGFNEPHGYEYKAANPFAGLNQIKPGTLQPGLGTASGPDYLNYDIVGRGWSERMFLTVGTTYLVGIGLGGAFGFFEGLRSSPSNKFNIRLNTVLNKMGRRGSTVGNAIGSLSLIYSLSGVFLDKMLDTDHYFDKIIPSRNLAAMGTPVLAGVLTGVFYKSTMGPKTMFLAGIIGATFAGVIEGTKKVFDIKF